MEISENPKELITNLKDKVNKCTDTIQNLRLELMLANAIIQKSEVQSFRESFGQEINNNEVDISFGYSDLDNQQFLEYLKNVVAEKGVLTIKNQGLLEAKDQLEKSLASAQTQLQQFKNGKNDNDIQELLKLLESWKSLAKAMHLLEFEVNAKINSKNQKLDSLNLKIMKFKKSLETSPSTTLSRKMRLEKLEVDLKIRDEEIAGQLMILKKLEQKDNDLQKLKQKCHVEQEFGKRIKEQNYILHEKLANERRVLKEATENWEKEKEELQRQVDGWKKLCDARVASTIKIMSENVEKDIESIKRTFISERSRIAKQHDLEIQKYQKQLEESEEMGQKNRELKQANEAMREDINSLKEQVEKLSSQRREFERDRVRNSLKRKAPDSPESARNKFSSID
jgi:hypothetical protein